MNENYQDLEQMANDAEFNYQKPTKGEFVKVFVKGVYDTAKQYVSTQVQQVAEDIKDIAVQAKNATQRVELTAAYIDALDQRITADLGNFEAVALKQYGEGFSGQTTEEGNERVMNRIGTRYNGSLRGLKAKLMLFVDSDTKPELPDATYKKLAGMITGYEINNAASRMNV